MRGEDSGDVGVGQRVCDVAGADAEGAYHTDGVVVGEILQQAVKGATGLGVTLVRDAARLGWRARRTGQRNAPIGFTGAPFHH